MKRILVTDAGRTATRNFVASLRMAGEPFYIVGTDQNAFHLACADLDATYLIPPPEAPDHLEVLHEIIASERISLVHAQGHDEASFLSEYRAEFPGLLFLPDHGDIVATRDRMHVHRLCEAAGVPTPSAVRVHDYLDFEQALEELGAPESRVWLRTVRGIGKTSIPVSNGRQARMWVQYGIENGNHAATDFMLATLLPGLQHAFQSLWYEGVLITSMACERVANTAGVSNTDASIFKTVHRKDLNELAQRAVNAVTPRPHGVFTVRLREDAAGVPSVTGVDAGLFMEANNFFAAAGCNMPYFYVRMAFGARIPRVPQVDAAEDELYWVRGVDRKPHLFKGAPWIQRRAA